MASRRKSTTPCMVLPSANVLEEQDTDMEVVEGKDGTENAVEEPGDAAMVSTETETEHDVGQSGGEDGIGCAAVVKRSDPPTLEQTVSELLSDSGYTEQESGDGEDPNAPVGISLSKTPIMKMRGKSEAKRITMFLKAVEEVDQVEESEGEQEAVEAPSRPLPPGEIPHYTDPMKHSVVVNIPNAVSSEQKKSVLSSSLSGLQLPAGLAQVLSALQAQQTAQAQLLIPVSSIPSYNQSMDTNVVLVNTYQKFPYPSLAEIMRLSAQTKFSEEQIKIWFSAQRLKHGVSWTPEEVEEARRKQFNGTVHTVPQTITVIPAHHLSAVANGLQSILQTCQIVGQPGLVFTQVGTPVTTPITLTVAGHGQNTKMSSQQATPSVSEMKRATTIQPPSLTPQENSALNMDAFGMRPKKSKEQLAELKASYLKNHFASDAEIARLMKLTSLTKGEIKKWFSDTRYNQRNSKNSHVIVFHDNHSPKGHGNHNHGAAIVIDSSDETRQSPLPVRERETRPKTWNSFPDFTLQKFKEKTPQQLVLLEESYQTGGAPSDDELTRLRTETKLTRREIDAWFTEKRKAAEASSPELRAERLVAEVVSSRRRSQTPPGGRRPNRAADRGVGKKTPEQLHVLKNAFVGTQWPSAEEYDKLAEESGLPRAYIVNWFGDTRYSFKNGNLKWFFHYQSGNVDGLNGNGNRNRKRRIRNRGWGGRSRNRKSKRFASVEMSPPPVVKFKSGKDILKEYYLKHKFLNEQDLDELVAKSSMGYEQVREWFAEVHRREDLGSDLFGDVAATENPENEDDYDDEEELQAVTELTAEEDKTVVDEDDDDDEDDCNHTDSDSWEPSQSTRKPRSSAEK
ncbi:hypothetical protein DPEC_G00051040 [Dallia pectoralis]|uniref:Uncharacterized protein n=1 Tax=Dallia pectoralis TaxID=75939 RepID=A0ACC2HCK2_DALPE|nr:hypothetical protein DPEC_G00051040 [Dallia pectoralis]